MSGDITNVAPGALDWRRERITPYEVLRWIALYLVLVWLTVLVAGNAQVVLPWFPPVGLSLAAAIIYGWRAAPMILVADALQLILRDAGGGVPESIVQGAAQAALWTATGMLIRDRIAAGPPLSRLRDAAWMVLAGVIAGSGVAAVVGVAVLDAVGQTTWTSEQAFTYFVGDAIGVVAVTPTILVFKSWERRLTEGVRRAGAAIRGPEGLSMLAGLILVPVVLIPFEGGDLLALAPLPLGWVALRRGTPWGALATTIWTLSAVLTFRFAGTEVALDQISSTLAAGGLFALLAGAVVSERERARARLAHLALWDQATGLQSRASLTSALEQVLLDAEREDLAVLLVRVAVPGGGDRGAHMDAKLLREHTAAALLRATTAEATIARVGHGEFAVFVEGPDAERAGEFADSVLRELRRPAHIGPREYLLEPAIGIVRARDVRGMATASDVDGVLGAAERAAERAGRQGAGTGDFDDQLRDAIEGDSLMATELGEALERGELTLAFQPIIAVKDGTPLAVEALLRWEHPDRGMIGPDRFIPVAERCGLILPIGRWVLHEACRAAARWPDNGLVPLVLHVNVSPVQLHDELLADYVADVLSECGLPADRLCLELTESALVDDLDVAALRIAQLTDLGVRVALDDFGTGASSLSWLQRLPVAALKVDRTFIDGIEAHSVDWAIVTATLGLAQALHVGTVAEGVERAEQLTMLSELGCVAAQGYLISRPVPERDFVAWLVARQRSPQGEGGIVVEMPASRRRRGPH